MSATLSSATLKLSRVRAERSASSRVMEGKPWYNPRCFTTFSVDNRLLPRVMMQMSVRSHLVSKSKEIRMKTILVLILLFLPITARAEVFRCGEAKGISMYSTENHKISPDGFSGVLPVVIVDDNEMTIVWGDSKSAGGTEKAWKAVVIHRSPEAISGIALDASAGNSASMLFTIDVKRGYLYLSTHKESALFNASGAQSFVSKCSQ